MLIVSMKCILINLLLSQARPIASIYRYLVSLRKKIKKDFSYFLPYQKKKKKNLTIYSFQILID